MFFCRKKAAVIVDTYNVEPDEDSLDSPEAESSHCAWCGDPPDRYGSHGICSFHAEQIIGQSRSRRRDQE